MIFYTLLVSFILSSIKKSKELFVKLENSLNSDTERMKKFNASLPSKIQKLRDEILKARQIADGVSFIFPIIYSYLLMIICIPSDSRVTQLIRRESM